MRKRARRREALERMKNRAEKVFTSLWGMSKHDARKKANHMRMCSCPMCRNPRKRDGAITRQEQIAELNEKEMNDG